MESHILGVCEMIKYKDSNHKAQKKLFAFARKGKSTIAIKIGEELKEGKDE